MHLIQQKTITINFVAINHDKHNYHKQSQYKCVKDQDWSGDVNRISYCSVREIPHTLRRTIKDKFNNGRRDKNVVFCVLY